MKYYLPLILVVALLLCTQTSCRKDLLHWKEVKKIETGTNARLNRILFLNDGSAIIAGGIKYEKAVVLTSADRGDNWVYHEPAGIGVGLYGLAASPDGIVYGSGFYGTLVSCGKDGGMFRTLPTGLSDYLVGLSFPESGRGIAISAVTNEAGSVFLIDSSGKVQQRTDFRFALNDIVMMDTREGYICGNGAVMKTVNGGKDWKVLNVYFDNFTGLCTQGMKKAWTCGYNGSIYRTGNGGDSWTRLRNGNDITLPRYHLEDILFLDDDHGFAVGEKGLVTYTDDAGKHWMEFDRFTNDALLFIQRCPDGSLITGGENGSLFKIIF